MISRIFRKSNYEFTEMEQQILKAINHIKYVSKKGVTISGIQRFLKKKSTTTFEETSLGEIICEMQQNGKIDGKFKIMNPIYDDKNFTEDPRKIHPKTFHPEESVDTTLTIIMKIIAKPIKVLSMNILTLMIQIKLHLIVKLL